MNIITIQNLSKRIDILSKHLIQCKQKDFSAKRSIRILINRRFRISKWMKKIEMKKLSNN